MMTAKEYQELVMQIIDFSQEEIVRTSGFLNSNGEDNDGQWDNNWDRG